MIRKVILTMPRGEYTFNGQWSGKDTEIVDSLNTFCIPDGEVGNPIVICGEKARDLFSGDVKYQDDGKEEDEEVKY